MVSDIGTWVQLIVVGSLVAAGTGSAVQTGLVALATFMPQGIASPIGGLLADRFDRRRVFASALLAQSVMTGVLAVVLGLGVRDPGVLTLLILLGSAAGSLGQPAYSAMIPDLVGEDELVAMVSLGVYSWNAGRILGPLVGSLLAATVGPAWTIGFNAITFVGLALAVWTVRQPFLPPVDARAGDAGVFDRLAEGWQALRTTPGCLHVFTVNTMLNLTIIPFMGLIPIFVSSELGGGTGITGLVSSTQGIGAIAGGIGVTMLVARRRRSDILAGLVATLSVALACYALAPSVALVAVCTAVLGAGTASSFITTSAVMQRDAPAERRGRVLAFNQANMGVSYGLGLVLVGSIGDLAGLRTAFLLAAVAYPLGFLALTRRSTNWRRALDGGDVRVAAPTPAGAIGTLALVAEEV
jgi:MFS family permease